MGRSRERGCAADDLGSGDDRRIGTPRIRGLRRHVHRCRTSDGPRHTASNRERRERQRVQRRRQLPQERRLSERDHPPRLGIRRRLDAMVVEGQRGIVGCGLQARARLVPSGLAGLPFRLERKLGLPADADRRLSGRRLRRHRRARRVRQGHGRSNRLELLDEDVERPGRGLGEGAPEPRSRSAPSHSRTGSPSAIRNGLSTASAPPQRRMSAATTRPSSRGCTTG